jgi:hypothetical protein
MGHDISAYLGEKEVAYLRRSAFSDYKRNIYIALNAEEHYCGVSGCGTDEKFSKERIEHAMLQFDKENEAHLAEIKFLNDCLANLDENGEVEIFFC